MCFLFSHIAAMFLVCYRYSVLFSFYYARAMFFLLFFFLFCIPTVSLCTSNSYLIEILKLVRESSVSFLTEGDAVFSPDSAQPEKIISLPGNVPSDT